MSQTDPLHRDQNRGRSIWFIGGACLLALAIVLSAGAAWQYQREQTALSAPFSDLVGHQLADAAAPLVVSDNRLALQALAQKTVQHQSVAHAAFYNMRNQLLAQAGKPSMADQGIAVRREVSMQRRLLGYARVTLLPTEAGWLNAGLLSIMGTVMGVLSLLALARAVRRPEVVEEARPTPSLMDKQFNTSYQELPEPQGEYGIIAVELLQLPLMRRQLSEDTLYEYLTTFEHWLEQVANLYSAHIRVGETGFTLALRNEDQGQLVQHTCCCAYALMKTLNSANRLRSARSEPVFEARIGAHLSAPLQSDARLLRELYAQDAHRQAWRACAGKAAGTVHLSHSIVAHPECAEVRVGSQDENGFYELQGLEPEVLQDIDRKVSSISNNVGAHKAA